MSDAVVIVSLGPGDPELITCKALKALQQADVVFCPTTDTSSRAMDILVGLGISEDKVERFGVPMSKERKRALAAYEAIADRIAQRFGSGDEVAVIAEGDAGFYSSVHYISDNLRLRNVPTRKIAGVPAFIACGALANLHIVKREDELVVIPGTSARDTLRQHMEAGRTVVVMKPSQCEAAVKECLSDEGSTFHYFENAGVSGKEYYTTDKDTIRERTFPYFSLLIIHNEL